MMNSTFVSQLHPQATGYPNTADEACRPDSARKHVSWIAQSTSIRRRPPTEQTYQEFQDAYVYFNRRLFDATLPDCLITMQRHGRSYGYFCHGRFVNSKQRTERTDEIALNPSFFVARTETGVLSTLVHEMSHLWQLHFGKHPRTGYHNRQWADRMIALGLYPSNSGQPGGAETGYSMTHYLVEDGPFDLACRELLLSGFQFSWLDDRQFAGALQPTTTRAQPGRADCSNRWKYTCPSCGLNAWAKPQAALVCGVCIGKGIVVMAPNRSM